MESQEEGKNFHRGEYKRFSGVLASEAAWQGRQYFFLASYWTFFLRCPVVAILEGCLIPLLLDISSPPSFASLVLGTPWPSLPATSPRPQSWTSTWLFPATSLDWPDCSHLRRYRIVQQILDGSTTRIMSSCPQVGRPSPPQAQNCCSNQVCSIDLTQASHPPVLLCRSK